MFKVGDRVRIVETYPGSDTPRIGEIGKIIEIGEEYDESLDEYAIKVKFIRICEWSHSDQDTFMEEELQLVSTPTFIDGGLEYV